MTEVLIDESRLGDVVGKVAVVTGGASGIGRALVTLLHTGKAITFFCDVNEAAGKEVTSSFPKNVHFIQADVSNFRSLASFFKYVHESAGRIDMVFANAGVIQQSSIWDDEYTADGEVVEPELTTLDVTLKGVVFTAKLAMAYFRKNKASSQENGGGALVFTASSSSYNERPMLPLYSVAKHGVLALMRSLRSASITRSHNIHVAAVAPGGTATAMVPPALASRMEAAGVAIQQPEFIALALLVLASNPDCNGMCYALHGGRGFEVEGKVRETMPLWYGGFGTEQALAVTNVSFGRVE